MHGASFVMVTRLFKLAKTARSYSPLLKPGETLGLILQDHPSEEINRTFLEIIYH